MNATSPRNKEQIAQEERYANIVSQSRAKRGIEKPPLAKTGIDFYQHDQGSRTITANKQVNNLVSAQGLRNNAIVMNDRGTKPRGRKVIGSYY